MGQCWRGEGEMPLGITLGVGWEKLGPRVKELVAGYVSSVLGYSGFGTGI